VISQLAEIPNADRGIRKNDGRTRLAKRADSNLCVLREFGAWKAGSDFLFDEIEFLLFQQNPHAHLARMCQWLDAHEDHQFAAISDDPAPKPGHIAGIDGQVQHEALGCQQRTRCDRTIDMMADSVRFAEAVQRTIRCKCPARNRERCRACGLISGGARLIGAPGA